MATVGGHVLVGVLLVVIDEDVVGRDNVVVGDNRLLACPAFSLARALLGHRIAVACATLSVTLLITILL